ncbi:TrkA family potassium uptake protein [Mycoplasma sp. 2045]|uniref:potassium channel family protein n=1 Tax=unclassified Mycoplasma TaxID=2683645 RepID=UPI00211C55D4|nr:MULTISPECIES: TrkA family potassium uptake protein [unclassified Mycoplasma]MEA4134363.1 TrkA family potassium uptake protein [Mycoplasma sp. 2704]MEA4206004.1 TrkA family potassium uptake protein [Mycoplasma sp. 1199]UUM20277.1 TrkA family potassium uptake protein [Mycoplasma sp. 2045]
MKLKYENEIVVIGTGRFGQAVIDQLIKLKKDVVILDKDDENAKLYADEVDKIIIGDAADTRTLQAIGIDQMETVVVAVSDNIEIVAALLELKVKNIIARASTKRHARVLKQIGVNVIIRPEFESGTRTALIAANKNFIRYSETLQEIGGNFVVGSTKIKNQNLFNKQVKEIGLNEKSITIVLIQSADKVFKLATGDVTLHKDDNITIIGEIGDVTTALEWFNKVD